MQRLDLTQTYYHQRLDVARVLVASDRPLSCFMMLNQRERVSQFLRHLRRRAMDVCASGLVNLVNTDELVRTYLRRKPYPTQGRSI